MSEETSVDEFARAWNYLAGHPALNWVPPFWRQQLLQAAESRSVRAIERNLSISMRKVGSKGLICLGTGPLRDLVRGDQVDPLTPLMVQDPRLQAEAETFEQAIIRLADAVRALYSGSPGEAGDAHETASQGAMANKQLSILDAMAR
jgi:hypothetical protein